MENILLHEYRIPIKGVKKKTFYQFSDVHLNEYDDLSSEGEIQYAKERVDAWERVRRALALGHGEPYGEAQQLPPRKHFENLVEAVQDGDFLVLTGDLIDSPAGANLRLVERLLQKNKVPFLFVPGNHEEVDKLPGGESFGLMQKPTERVELEDLVLLGVDDSQRKITPEQIAVLEETLQLGKPVILVLHMPILTADNEELKACEDYYYINYEGAPAENFRFARLVLENADKIAAVFAGHLHFENVHEIAPGLVQYVSSQGITGHLSKYIIGE